MGTTQMEEPETFGDKTSKSLEKARRTSVESSTSPKAAQPSCLRGAFICLFLKRAERVNWGEEPSRKNQNTEDKEDVKGKKRRVVGASIFRLPCLRPAERESSDEQLNSLQEKIEEQSNQIIAIEELKPYSKASFLRKIRGYRLMRERDATEKEKVVEIGHCIHGVESVVAMEQGEKVIERSHEDEKGNALASEECRTDRLGGLGKNLLEQDGQAESVEVIDNGLTKQDVSAEKIKEQGKDLLEEESQIVVGRDKDSAKQDYHEEKVEKLESPSSGTDVQVRESCQEKLEDLGSQQLEHTSQGEEVPRQGKDSPTPKNQASKEDQLNKDFEEQKSQPEEVGKVRDDFPELESSSDRVQNLSEQDINAKEVGKILPEQESHFEEMGKVGNKLQKQKRLAEEVGKVEYDLPEEENETGKVGHHSVEQERNREEAEKLGDNLSEQESETGNVIHCLVEQETHTEEVEQLGDNLPEKNSETGNVGHSLVEQENHTEVEKLGGNLPEQESETGKVGHHFIEQESHTEEVEKLSDNLPEQERETGKVEHHSVEQENHTGEVEKLGDNLSEQESETGKVGHHLVEQESHTEEMEKLGDNLPEQESETGKVGHHSVEQESHTEEVKKLGDNLPEQESETGKVGHHSVEQESHTKEVKKLGDNLPEQESETGKVGHHLVEQESHTQEVKKLGDNLPEQESETGKVGHHLIEKESHTEEMEKLGDNLPEQEIETGKVGEQGNDPLVNGSYKEKVEELILDIEEDAGDQGKDIVAKENLAQKVGESGKNSTDFPQTSSAAKDRQHVPASFRDNLTQEGTMRNFYQELKISEECQQDSITSRTCDSTETRVLDTSVRKKTLATHTRNNTKFQERHTQSVAFQDENMTSTSYKVDPVNKEQETNQKGISNEEDVVVGGKGTDWGSLRVEVKDMVQWLVQEASDRLTNYTEESHATG